MAGDTSWQRYWAVVGRLAPGARAPEDVFVDGVVARARGGRWLDAGCGRHSFPFWRADEAARVGAARFGCDLDRAALADRSDGAAVCAATLERLPFRDGSFALVTSNMVFEHLEQPEPSAAELARVTAPGGRILVHTVNGRHWLALLARATPFAFHRWIVARVEGRAPEDVYPTRYRANTPRRLRALFEAHGCRWVGGGTLRGIPLRIPLPGLFWLGIALGLAERALARLPGLDALLAPNLLVELERLPAPPSPPAPRA